MAKKVVPNTNKNGLLNISSSGISVPIVRVTIPVLAAGFILWVVLYSTSSDYFTALKYKMISQSNYWMGSILIVSFIGLIAMCAFLIISFRHWKLFLLDKQ
ncbi:MAG: hypothetical protein OWR52_06145 [Acidibacillus sp.]|nr:hypothetical protein [Acidibacillus sp.]